MKKRLMAIAVALLMIFSFVGCVAAEETPAEAPVVDTIAESYAAAESVSEWQVLDMAAYSALCEKKEKDEYPKLSDDRKSEYVAAASETVAGQYAAITDFSKTALIFSSIGEGIEDVGGISLKEKLETEAQINTYSDAIWLLFADELEGIELSSSRVESALTTIRENTNADGLLFGTWGESIYTDIDSTGWAVGALYPLCEKNEAAAELCEKMISALSQNLLEGATYGNTYTDASVMVGLLAAGIDVTSDVRFIKNEKSLYDGLMLYLNEDKTGFTSGYSSETDAWATEQAFRALVAWEMFVQNGKTAYNIHTFPGKEGEKADSPEQDTKPSGNVSGGLSSETVDKEENKEQEKEDKNEETAPGQNVTEEEPEEQEKTISVTFGIKTHKKSWMSGRRVALSENATVQQLCQKVFSESGIDAVGISSGYIRSITYKGETWGEFDAGKNSGWQYSVNGELPRVGIESKKLYDGDNVLLFYAADYTQGENSEEEDESEKETETEEAPEKEEKKEEEIKESFENPFSDIEESAWYFSSVRYVYEKGLMNGVGEKSFAPKSVLSRAMFVTMLYRIEGAPAQGASSFQDVPADSWYASAVSWAVENGIVSGVSEKSFAPDDNLSREQMATLAYRYARYKKKGEEKKEGITFSDSDKISPYANDAIAWANAAGIMKGSGEAFNPAASSMRCEAAAVLQRLDSYIAG